LLRGRVLPNVICNLAGRLGENGKIPKEKRVWILDLR
jgi:hypothetical protein